MIAVASKQGIVGLRFRTEHRANARRIERRLERPGIGKTGVHPKLGRIRQTAQSGNRIMVRREAGDGVEIGNVEGLERVERTQPLRNRDGIGAFRKRRHDRPVAVAFALFGAHHLAVFQVEDRDDTHDFSCTVSAANMKA